MEAWETEIRWKRQWGPTDEIIWVDVEKLNASWSKDDSYLGPDSATTDDQHDRYIRFGEWLRENLATTEVCIPHIGVDDGIVFFTDGRHRFAWCRDHGVKYLPITTSPGCYGPEIEKLFGTEVRQSMLPRSNR